MHDKAIPLCLPNNLQWNPRTGEIQKLRRARRDLYVVKEAFTELQKVKGASKIILISCFNFFLLSDLHCSPGNLSMMPVFSLFAGFRWCPLTLLQGVIGRGTADKKSWSLTWADSLRHHY